MVNYGSSAACWTCKKRKIKCDQARPGCQRCEKIGKQCPGYLDEWDINFRSENEALRAKAADRQLLSRGTSTAPGISQATSARSSVSRFLKTSICERLSDDLDQHAISLFFKDYTIESCGRCPGYLNFLPQMYSVSTEHSLLPAALLAAAYANKAQKLNCQDLTIKAMSYYRKALRVASAVLTEKVETTSDSTMTAIMLLGLYECINTTISEIEAMQHTQGLVVILNLRLEVLAEGPSLLQTVCCQMQRRNLDLRLPPRSIHTRLVNFLDMSKPANQMVLSMQHVSQWVAEVHMVILAGHANPPYEDLLHDFALLEEELCEWSRISSISLSYQKVRSDNATTGVKHDNYSGFWTVGIWNKHRATRIILHQLLLELFQSMGEIKRPVKPDIRKLIQQRSDSLAVIREMTGDILASVPFSLGQMSVPPKSVGGYFLVWSLQTILQCPFTPFQQHNEALAVLERVGSQCGIRCASMIAKNSQQYDMHKKSFTVQFTDSSACQN